MITLQHALSLSPADISDVKKDLKKRIKNSALNAYILPENGEILDADESKIPILIKDNISVKNWPITCASRILAGYFCPYDAHVINRLNENRMAPFGRANMDEFAMGSTTENSVYGATKNPLDPERVPGGSSGGSAAAVGGGLAIAALGSDTGGSIRQPAAFCGCVGLKPTYGSVSRYGLIAYSSSLDQIGPITQNVKDCALLFDAIKGPDTRDSTSAHEFLMPNFPRLDPKKRFKIAVLKDFANDADAPIQRAYEDTIKILQKMGHEIIEKSMLKTQIQIAVYYVISTAEASSNLARFDGVRYGMRENAASLKEMYVQTRARGFGDEVKRRIMLGTFVLSSGHYDAYYVKAQKIRALIRQNYEEILRDCDLIFTPITPNVPPKIGEILNPLKMYLSDIYTVGANLSTLPALSLTIAKTSENLPIGAQILGRAFDEQSIFDCALGLENEICVKF